MLRGDHKLLEIISACVYTTWTKTWVTHTENAFGSAEGRHSKGGSSGIITLKQVLDGGTLLCDELEKLRGQGIPLLTSSTQSHEANSKIHQWVNENKR